MSTAPQSLAITHTAAAGTILAGTSRGDGIADLVKPLRWRWSANLTAWYLPRSRDADPQLVVIAATAAALRSAGHAVEVTVDPSSRTTADIEADKVERADRRANRLRLRADRLAADAVVAAERADRAVDRLPPMGEPIKVGHHSEMPHRRAIDRAHQAMGASVAADEVARAADQRAAAAAATTGARYSPSTVANRIARLQAEERRTRRKLDGDTTAATSTTADRSGDHDTAAGRRRDQLLQRHQDCVDQISYWTEIRRQQLDAGQATGHTAATVAAGDLVVVRGRVRRVVRANTATATVRSDHSWNDRVPWHEVRDLVTSISVPDPDPGPNSMPIYEGLSPETGLVDGTYTALLSTDRRAEPLEVAITISAGRLTAPAALTTPTRHRVRNDL